MKNILFAILLTAALCSPVSACPMCKSASEDAAKIDPNAALQPTAYAASIAFMLLVPAGIFSTLGYGLYRMAKAEAAAIKKQDENHG
ncbi:hypothetical protein [Lacunimicrobium album]